MEEVHIGHYILGKTIGTGGFAKVKQARHDLTGVKVAVKIINKRKMKSKHMISKVKREIRILKFINHFNIIKLYEVLDTTNDIFVIMELAEGGQLYDYIQNNDIQEDEARFFFKQIVSGVTYAHDNLIAHRDLKPENILIDNNRLIKIVDFGLSNLMKDGRLLKTACGSPNYAAPQIVGERKYEGTSIDVWSCGVILYALLAGQLPFDEETVTLLYKKIEQGIYTIPTCINPRAADLIRRMLQVNPYHRIRMHDVLNHPWMRHSIPIYVYLPSFIHPSRDEPFEVDPEIYQKVKGMNFLLDANDEKIKKSIKQRDDESFVITYELLKDQKFRKERTGATLNELKSTTLPSNIIGTIPNQFQSSNDKPRSQSFPYGRRFNKPSKILAELAIQTFVKLGVQFSVKNSEYSIKCSFSKHAMKGMRKSKTTNEMMDENEEIRHREVKHRKDIQFTMQIYNVDLRGYQHVVDLQLTQGHPLAFFNLSHKIYSMIQHLCQTH